MRRYIVATDPASEFEMVSVCRRLSIEQFYTMLRPALMQISVDSEVERAAGAMQQRRAGGGQAGGTAKGGKVDATVDAATAGDGSGGGGEASASAPGGTSGDEDTSLVGRYKLTTPA